MITDTSILLRVEGFLAKVPPFSMMSRDERQQLSRRCEVAVYKAGDKVFSTGQYPRGVFFLVRKGAIDLSSGSDSSGRLVDKCGEMDIFGIRPILAESAYELDAICVEPSIIYELPIDLFRSLYLQSPEAVEYMLRRFAAGRVQRDSWRLGEDPVPTVATTAVRLYPSRALVTTPDNASLQQAVETMARSRVSSVVVVDEDNLPAGILTDRDIRNTVAAGYDGSLPVTSVMSHPVSCISPGLTLQEVQLAMIELGLHHLCVTEDGTAHSKGLGMITEHDILYANASNPVVVLKKIKRAKRIDALKQARAKVDTLLHSYVDATLDRKITLSLIDQLNRAIVRRAVVLAREAATIEGLQIDDSKYSFYTMGSAARGEQLMMTDQDNGLLLDDSVAGQVDDYRRFGAHITDILNQVGYEYCPAGMMASEPDWCMTLSDMQVRVSQWMLEPTPEAVLYTAIFFDYRHEYGDLSLSQRMRSFINDRLGQQDLYVRFLANQAIQNPPPLSFFRRFIIDKDGESKDLFDIKLRGISPLTDAARVLALGAGYLLSSSTVERYAHLASIDTANAELYMEATQSLLDMMAMRLRTALATDTDGRYIDPRSISKVDRVHLRRDFEPARLLLDMIERRFKLGYLS